MPHRSIRDAISPRKPYTASGDTTVDAAARMMKKHDVGALMIVEQRRLVGIFTERDALFRVLAKNPDPGTTRVHDVMTRDPKTVDPDKEIGYALLMMYNGGFRHVPVVEHGRPIGMVFARDSWDPSCASSRKI
jgi:CBS domain-containing protein